MEGEEMESMAGEGQIGNVKMVSGADITPAERGNFLDGAMQVENSAWPPELVGERSKFESRLEIFPQGFIAAEKDGKIVGFTTSQIVNYDPDTKKTWDEVTDNGTLRTTHTLNGDSLYVSSVAVSPEAQGEGVGGKLVDAQKEVIKELGLKRLFLGARIPGYDQYCKEKGDISAEDYLQLKNEKGEPIDPEIRFYARQGLRPAKVVPEFEPDIPSRNFGVVMVWENK